MQKNYIHFLVFKIINKYYMLLKKLILMKLTIQKLILVVIIFQLFYQILLAEEPPAVSVNYLPKKQWKLSKHDLADIKLDIEREMRSKVLQLQMDWQNRQRQEEAMVFNQFTPVIPPSFFSPSLYPQAPAPSVPTHINNSPRFNQLNNEQPEEENIQPTDDETENLKNMMNLTREKLKNLKKELEILKSEKKNLKTENVKINNSTNIIGDVQTKEVKIRDSSNIDKIVKKYSLHNAENELAVFSKIFKNYNMTNSNHVDIKQINKRIQETMQDPNVIKLLQNDEIISKKYVLERDNKIEKEAYTNESNTHNTITNSNTKSKYKINSSSNPMNKIDSRIIQQRKSEMKYKISAASPKAQNGAIDMNIIKKLVNLK